MAVSPSTVDTRVRQGGLGRFRPLRPPLVPAEPALALPPQRPPGPPDGLWPGGSWPFPGPRAPPGTCPHRPGLIPPTAQGAQIPAWHLSSPLLDSLAAPHNSSCEGRLVHPVPEAICHPPVSPAEFATSSDFWFRTDRL